MWVPHFHELALTPLWKQKPQHFDAHSHKAPNFESASQNCLWSFYAINYQVINISTPIIASKHIQTHTHIYIYYKLKPSGFVLYANHICIYVHLNIHSHRPLDLTRPRFLDLKRCCTVAPLSATELSNKGPVRSGAEPARCHSVLTAPQMMSSNRFFFWFFEGEKKEPETILGGSSHARKWGYNPSYKWDFCRVNPLITGVITHLLSGISHQVGFYQILRVFLLKTCHQSNSMITRLTMVYGCLQMGSLWFIGGYFYTVFI